MVSKLSKEIIKNFTKLNLLVKPQKKSFMDPYPRRKPEDGKIDWKLNENKINSYISFKFINLLET